MGEVGGRVPITALVHTYNAEVYLDEVLSALEGFDELLVCDMHSTDRTHEICAAHGARVIFHEHTGYVEPARNFAINSASNEWVLIVDSDEVVSPALRDYVHDFVECCVDEVAALQVPRLEYFMGHSLRSTYPDFVTRLVRRGRVDWPITIHSRPNLQGELQKIPSKRRDLALKHYSNPSVAWRLDKINIYTDKEVERKARKAKYSSFWFTLISANWRFFKGYVVKGGFLDGKAGLAYAILEFYYKFVVLFKIWEFNKK